MLYNVTARATNIQTIHRIIKITLGKLKQSILKCTNNQIEGRKRMEKRYAMQALIKGKLE